MRRLRVVEPVGAEMRQVRLEGREVGIGVAAHEKVHRRAFSERRATAAAKPGRTKLSVSSSTQGRRTGAARRRAPSA